MAVTLTLVEINELLALIDQRIIAAEAEQSGASHSNQAIVQDEIDLLMELQTKLEAASATAAPGFNNAASVMSGNAANAANVANAAANAAVVNAAVANAAAVNAAAAANVSGNFHPLGGRRRRSGRKSRKTRKGRKGSRKGRKGSRRA